MHITTSSDKLAFKTAAKISDLIEAHRGEPILLLLCGGSSLQVYDSIRPEGLSDLVTVAVTDDRFSRDMDVNNFHLLQATTFYSEIIDSHAFAISTEVFDEEKPEQLAERFEKGLRAWRKDFPDGVVIATFGIGEDGHTSGMMPDADKAAFKVRFVDTDHWVVGYHTPANQYHERITITVPFIRSQVNHAVIYATGEAKRPALERFLSPIGNLHETPARILRELKDVYLFTDLIV
jgi:6-phosphogluconolactonase/glucosamine-6-phosphate isomerase/deaminase